MTDEPQTAVGEAELRERIDSIIIFARDSLDNGFLTGGDVGNVFGIRDNAVALGQDLSCLLSSVSERERGLVADLAEMYRAAGTMGVLANKIDWSGSDEIDFEEAHKVITDYEARSALQSMKGE